MSTSECGAIGFSHEEVMWPILSLNNDLELCDDKKLRVHKNYLTPEIWDEMH